MYNSFTLIFLVVILWQGEDTPHPIPNNIITRFILVGIDEYLHMYISRNSNKPYTWWCVMGGLGSYLILHIFCDLFFLHDRLGLVLGISFLYLILLWFLYLGWFLCHLHRHFLPCMMGPFLFLESWYLFLNNVELTLLFSFHVWNNFASL